MLENRPEDVLDLLVETAEIVETEDLKKKVTHSVCDNLKARDASTSKNPGTNVHFTLYNAMEQQAEICRLSFTDGLWW